MNQEAQAALDAILAKNPQVLTRDEIAFLRARQSYLKDSQKEEYKSVLSPKEDKPNPAESGTVNKNAKKSK